MARELHTITVRDLIALLNEHDEGMLVMFAADYGDYSKTEQAFPIAEHSIETRSIRVERGYSNSGFAVAGECECGAEDTDDCDCFSEVVATDVLVLGARS